MIPIRSARLREPCDVEDRLIWGTAFDAGNDTSAMGGHTWSCALSLDPEGWLHIERCEYGTDPDTGERVMLRRVKGRVPPDMIRIVYDAEPTALAPIVQIGDDKPLSDIQIAAQDPNWRHPKSIKR